MHPSGETFDTNTRNYIRNTVRNCCSNSVNGIKPKVLARSESAATNILIRFKILLLGQLRSAGAMNRASTIIVFPCADAPPVLLYSFIEQTLQPGPAVSLKCSASGNPTPQISWLLDGFPLPSHGR